jgi:hypothetical protein
VVTGAERPNFRTIKRVRANRWRDGEQQVVLKERKKIDLVVWGVKSAQEPINFFSLRNIRRKLKNKIFTIIVFNFFFFEKVDVM